MAAAALPVGAAEPLVDVAWLKSHRTEAGVVVLDIRSGFAGGHVPGAVGADYATAGWRVDRDGVPGMLAPVADLEALIGGLGISRASHVIVVADGKTSTDMGAATRVYWTFKVLGHDRVSVLDGGFAAWTADSTNPVERGARDVTPVAYKADFRREIVADRADVAAALESGVTLVDNRPADQYAGAKKHPDAKRAGTIPTAVNLQQQDLTVDGSGRFISLARLGELLKSAGLKREGEQITFCNTGHWASLGWFALSEIGGNKRVRMYDGSMVDWTANSDAPVVQKAASAN
ncbi:MAG: sulfurtransferase [Proteobacteria bacterium]|nr:sulfurtransferase [Pseudomonadota bacterium]